MDANGFLERTIAGKWIAGPWIEDAIAEAKRLNRSHIRAIINDLGEAFEDEKLVGRSVDTYIELVEEIKRRGIHADIALKLTQLGLRIGKTLAEKNYRKVLEFAKKNSVFVWIDMEEQEYVKDTIDMYNRLQDRSNAGICIQSYLRQSIDDLKRLRGDSTVRLVKGAYSAASKLAFATRGGTTENYYSLMNYLFTHFKRFTIGTHDTAIIEKAIELNRTYKRDVTYAMLKGIRNNYAVALAKSGEKVSIYVPFGVDWIPYSYRRMKERSIFLLFARSLLWG